MDELGSKLIEQAGPVGAALGVAILAAGAVIARAKGWLGFSQSPKGTEPEAGTDDEVMTGTQVDQRAAGKIRWADQRH